MEYHFIHLISDYDEYELWQVESRAVKSFAHWLNHRCGLHPLVAREKIRVARRLQRLRRYRNSVFHLHARLKAEDGVLVELS